MLCLAAVSVRTAQGAWPRLLMVHGGSLEKAIVVHDWDGIREIFHPASVEDSEPVVRPSLELTLFWGPKWNQYVEEGEPLEKLKPEDAKMDIIVPTKGRFYPSCGDSAAIFALSTFKFGPDRDVSKVVQVWQVSAAGLAVFERFDVPVRLDCELE